MLPVRRCIAMIVTIILLAACGGHGGGSGSSPSVVPQSLPSNTTISQVKHVRQVLSVAGDPTARPATTAGPNYYTPWAGFSGDHVPIGNDVGTSRCTVPQGWGGVAYCYAVPVGDPKGLLKNIPINVPGIEPEGCKTIESRWFSTGLLSYVTFKPEDNFFAYGQSAKTLVSIDVTGKPVGTNEQIYVQPSSLLGEGCNAQPITPGDDPPYWQQSTIQYYILPTPSPTPKPTATPCPPLATPGPNPLAPVSVTPPPTSGASGPQLTGGDGRLVFRPNDGHDPAYFEHLGSLYGPVAGVAQLPLFFLNAGVLDEQRPLANRNNYNDLFVDYASIAVGLFGCGAGIPQSNMLNYYNMGAVVAHSQWDPKITRDVPAYPNLPLRNTNNIGIGYKDCQNRLFPYCH